MYFLRSCLLHKYARARVSIEISFARKSDTSSRITSFLANFRSRESRAEPFLPRRSPYARTDRNPRCRSTNLFVIFWPSATNRVGLAIFTTRPFDARLNESVFFDLVRFSFNFFHTVSSTIRRAFFIVRLDGFALAVLPPIEKVIPPVENSPVENFSKKRTVLSGI